MDWSSAAPIATYECPAVRYGALPDPLRGFGEIVGEVVDPPSDPSVA